LEAHSEYVRGRGGDFRASVIRDVRDGVEAIPDWGRVELLAPFSRQIAEPLDADAVCVVCLVGLKSND
jgi:hypothetical protein